MMWQKASINNKGGYCLKHGVGIDIIHGASCVGIDVNTFDEFMI